jgi:hypothetical protein
MGIPPIISGTLQRLFRSGRSESGAKTPQAAASPQGGDVVQISAEAQKKLEEAQVLTANDPGKIRAVTAQIRQYLERHPVTMGLDPALE